MIFQDFYNRYFKILDLLLKKASTDHLTEKDITQTIARHGFEESVLTLLPLIKSTPEAPGYPLFTSNTKNEYDSTLHHPPTRPFSSLERQWLKSMLLDDRCNLFMNSDLISKLNQLLIKDTALYEPNTFLWHGCASNNDNWQDSAYQNTFRTLHQAILDRCVVLISYKGAKGTHLAHSFLPHKLEYSQKDGKIRVLVTRMRTHSFNKLQRLNLSRIESVTLTENVIQSEHPTFETKKKPTSTLELEISNFRNGIERCFYQFSLYERSSDYDETTQKCRMRIDYLPENESELEIQVLSFGPAVKVISPPHFKQNIQKRLECQMQFLTP